MEKPWPEPRIKDAHFVADPGVVVDDEADLLAVEALRPVHVRHGEPPPLRASNPSCIVLSG